jgi:hypothetical protein
MDNRVDSTIHKRLLLGALLCAVLLIAGYFVLVSTPWGHQLDDDAFFGRQAVSRRLIGLDSGVLDRVTKATLLGVAGLLLIIAVVRRCAVVGLIAVAGFGCAVAGAEVLKRELPWRALVPNDALLDRRFQSCTYPSGHATIGTSLALSLVLVASSRWRPWLAVGAGCVSAVFATGVLFAGWHRPSDALGALAWSGFCMSVAAAIAVRFQGRPAAAIAHPGRAVLGSAGLGIVVAAATWLTAATAAPEYQCGDLPFFFLTGFIIAGAFSLIAWFAWLLRAVDWPAGES